MSLVLIGVTYESYIQDRDKSELVLGVTINKVCDGKIKSNDVKVVGVRITQ